MHGCCPGGGRRTTGSVRGQGALIAARSRKRSLSREELRKYFERNVEKLKQAADNGQKVQPELATALAEIARSLGATATLLDTPGTLDWEDLERRLTVLDEKTQALLTTYAPEDVLLKIRRELDGQLAAYRRKMKAEQLALVEKQYFQKRLLEEFALPRLSLFHLS